MAQSRAYLTLQLIILFSSCFAQRGYEAVDIEVDETPLLPCRDSELERELLLAVQSFLPMKQQLNAMQIQIQNIHNISVDTRRFMQRMRSEDADREILHREVERLRRDLASFKPQFEAAAIRSQSRLPRKDQQGNCEESVAFEQHECIAKIVKLSNEAHRDLAELREANDNLSARIAHISVAKEAQLEDLRDENEALRSQLEEMNSTAVQDCLHRERNFEDVSGESILERNQGQHQAQHQEVSASLFKKRHSKVMGSEKKDPTSISKVPSSSYKHSCKGFTEPSASVAPTPYETSIRIGNRQYIVGKEKVTWGDAWRTCKSRGMWMLTLETEQEQQQLEPHMLHMHNTPTNYWLFARKPQNSAWFTWECAASEDAEPWRQQPSRAGSASMRCAHVEFHRAGSAPWGDDACDQKLNYICRKLVVDC